jgi:hypothetical protein
LTPEQKWLIKKLTMIFLSPDLPMTGGTIFFWKGAAIGFGRRATAEAK